MTTLDYYISKKNKIEVNKKTKTYKRFIFNTILLIITYLSTINNSLASEMLIDLPTRVKKADYIFEGTVIHSKPYHKDRMIYTLNTVQITKILKGDLKCGTVEIITRGGSIEGYGTLEVSNGLMLKKGAIGVFLCKETKFPISDEDFYKQTNPQKLSTPFGNLSFIRYWKRDNQLKAFDYLNVYESIPLLHKQLEKITKSKFKKCIENEDTGLDDREKETQKEEGVLEIFPNYSKEEFDRLIEYAEYKRENYSKNVEKKWFKNIL